MFRYGSVLYFTGMVTDKVLNFLKFQNNIRDITIIVRDFTCLFITPEVLNEYKKWVVKYLYSTTLNS